MEPLLAFGWLRMESLQLEISDISEQPPEPSPAIASPTRADSSPRAPAESAELGPLQRQRLPLVDATLRLDRAGVDALLVQLAPVLAIAGFENVQLAFAAGVVELTARVRLREWTAELMARVAVEPAAEGRLGLRVIDAVTFGYVRRPALLLAHDLLLALTGVSADEPVSVLGLGRVELAPLERLRATLLEPSGWSLVSLDGLGVAGASIGAGAAELRWARKTAATTPDTPALAADEPGLHAIDDAIERNDLAQAAIACRQEAARHPEREPALTERLLSILCARDGTLADAAELAQSAQTRWPERVMPSLALAAVATFRGGGQAAAAHFADAARRAQTLGDALLAARAAVAAATQWRALDPAQALPLYQLALALRPDDRESSDALAELYATAGRWLELRAHIQARLPTLRDPAERLNGHLRAAELSYSRLRDPAAARVDLQAAAELAPDDRRVWERLAQLCEAAGDAPASIAALERLVAILATTDDRLAEARALVRMASRYEDLGDDKAAMTHYRRALALGPDDPGAQERFAGVAARQGDVAAAIDAYRQLYERGGGTSDRRRRAAQRLLQLLVTTGELASARQLLPALIDEPPPDVLIGLGRLEESSDELTAAADLWARAAAQLQGAEAAAAELERGRLCRLTAAFDDERVALARAFVLAPQLPEGIAALARLVVLSRVAGDVAAEADWIDRLLAAAPALTDPEHVTLALRRARLFVAAADAGGAARVLARLVDAGHDGPAVQRLDADVRGLAGDFAGRAAALEALAANAGEDAVSLWILAASSRLDAGDVAAADADCVAAAARAPDDAGVRAFAAELAWQRQDWDAVAALYGALAESTAGETRVAFAVRQAAAHEARGHDEAALAALDRAVSAADAGGAPLADAWRACAELYQARAEEATAAAVYARGGGDERVPTRERVGLWNRAAALFELRLGRTDDAAAALHEALALDGNDVTTLDALDTLQAHAGDEAALMTTLERKLTTTLTPEARIDTLRRLGALAATRGRADVARAALTELAAHEPAPLDALRWLAEDANALADDAAADLWDARLAQLDALSDDERRAANVRLATRAERHQRLDDAEARLWAAVELTPSAAQPPLLTRLQDVYTRAGRWADCCWSCIIIRRWRKRARRSCSSSFCASTCSPIGSIPRAWPWKRRRRRSRAMAMSRA